MDMDVIYSSQCRHISDGFTLIELLIAIAIVSILLGMAVPSLSAIIQSNRQSGHINQLVGHLNYARSEAIKRRINVLVCKSQDGLSCTSAGNWQDGWILFVDADGDRQHDSAEDLVAHRQPLGDNTSVSYAAFPTGNYVLFYPTGMSLGNGTFTFCDDRGSTHAKALVLYKTGRVRTASSMPDGSELSCPEG